MSPAPANVGRSPIERLSSLSPTSPGDFTRARVSPTDEDMPGFTIFTAAMAPSVTSTRAK